MEIDAKHRTYVVVPPSCSASQQPPSRFPIGADSYNYGQMSEVLAIFNRRWVSAGSPCGREPYALSSSRQGHVDLVPLRFTAETIASALVSEEYIERICEKEKVNFFMLGDLAGSEEDDSETSDTPNCLTYRGTPDVKKGKRRRRA